MVLVKIGVSLTNIMFSKIKKRKNLNPIAKDLRSPKYKQRSVKNKKIYNRKKKII